MRQKLHIITLGVDDLNKSAAFYEQGLGWKRSDKGNEHLILFPLGGMTMALYSRHGLAEDATLPNEHCNFSGLTLAYNAQSKAEVDEVLNKVKELGATIIKPAQEVFWGGYSGYFKDLDGHLFEVAYNPFWGFDEDGNLAL